jgi:hypothetical protein
MVNVHRARNIWRSEPSLFLTVTLDVGGHRYDLFKTRACDHERFADSTKAAGMAKRRRRAASEQGAGQGRGSIVGIMTNALSLLCPGDACLLPSPEFCFCGTTRIRDPAGRFHAMEEIVAVAARR